MNAPVAPRVRSVCKKSYKPKVFRRGWGGSNAFASSLGYVANNGVSSKPQPIPTTGWRLQRTSSIRILQRLGLTRSRVADISYVPTDEGWLYLAALKDLYTCEIVGRALSERMSKELVGRALIQAVAAKRPAAGLIHHSDRGSQYCSQDYRKLLEQFGMKASMSRKGNCYDNAPVESFFATLKTELVYHRRYQTRRQAVAEITEYIDLFYNRQRRHSRLGYLSPMAFIIKYWEKRQAA